MSTSLESHISICPSGEKQSYRCDEVQVEEMKSESTLVFCFELECESVSSYSDIYAG